MKPIIPLFYDYVLPNYIMPNALITELGIINYLHSLHSNRLGEHTGSFFEQSLNATNDNHSMLTLMLGNSLGSYPNSIGGSPHLMAGVYHGKVRCTENSLYLGKKYINKYVYPIKLTPYIDNFVGVAQTGSKVNGEYFWKHMSAEALEDARSGRAIIFLDYAQENFIEKTSYDNLHTVIKYSEIPASQIVLAFNSFNAKEIYESWYSPEERRLEVVNWPFMIANSSYFYSKANDAKVSLDDFLNSKSTLREHHFLLKIRRPRHYRQAILFKLHCDNLLQFGDWSWLSDTKYEEHVVDHVQNFYDFELDKEKVKELCSLFPKLLKYETKSRYDNVSAWTDSELNSYKNAYFYICTETYMSSEYKSFTEKICKPMANFLPFIFVSFPGALKLLRELGFKTFHPFINESYDDEPDEKKRLVMIYSEIERLCKMSKQEIHDWYWQMEDICIHNYNHLSRYYNIEQYGIELFKYLESKLKS